MAKQEVVTKNDALPAHLAPKSTSFGNTDASDRIIPRLKLLAAISPEVEAFEKAKAGEFWHTIGEITLGKSVRIIPIKNRKTFALWAPRPGGLLARASDAIHWDTRDAFKIPKSKLIPTEQIWDTSEGTVAGSGLDKFGSSVKGDPNSQPAAALTYTMMFYLPDFPELSPVVVINTRSAVKPCKLLQSKIDMRPVEHFGQVFDMGVVKESNADGNDYFNYAYSANGYATKEEYEVTQRLWETFKDVEEIKTNEERDDGDDAPRGDGGKVGGKSEKF